MCEAISLQRRCVKFCLNVGKLLIVLWVSRKSRLYPEQGIKMMEIKVAETNAPLN